MTDYTNTLFRTCVHTNEVFGRSDCIRKRARFSGRRVIVMEHAYINNDITLVQWLKYQKWSATHLLFETYRLMIVLTPSLRPQTALAV